MAEGSGKTFATTLQNVLGELGKAEAFPDADPAMIQQIRELIIPAVQQGLAAQDPMAQLQAAMGAGAEAPVPGPADPMQMQQAPGRLPTPPIDIGAI